MNGDGDDVIDNSPARSSFSLSTVPDTDEDLDELLLLPPPIAQAKNRRRPSSALSDRTPLVSAQQRQHQQHHDAHSVLFGQTNLDWKRNDDRSVDITNKPDGLAGYFFGFMYEEAHPDDYLMAQGEENLPTWSRLNIFLSAAYALTTAAATTPIALVPSIAAEFASNADTTFAARATVFALTGNALGKVITGCACDVFGARRVSFILALLLAASLLLVSLCQGQRTALWSFFMSELSQSGQWPAVIVTLSCHSRSQPKGTYEQGLYITSLTSRFGSLMAILMASILLARIHWRAVAHIFALVAIMGAAVIYLFVYDSPLQVHQPQNPISPATLKEFRVRLRASTSFLRTVMAVMLLIAAVVRTNLLPSLMTLFRSKRFWIVAIAHSAACMVRSSERILGTYFIDTSLLDLTETRASSLAMSLSIGSLLGVAIAGSMFRRRDSHGRKQMIVRLYMCTIAGCYLLAILAVPQVRRILAVSELILVFQVLTSVVMGFGVSVQSFQIPGLVGATFGHSKGLYMAYTDGIANGIGSVVWKIVANAVQEGGKGAGWFYGWSAVALLVVLCSICMIEFFEHYFVRAEQGDKAQPREGGGGYETIIFV